MEEIFLFMSLPRYTNLRSYVNNLINDPLKYF